MRKILLLCLCIIAVVTFAVWVPNTLALVGCTVDADCDDGVFCNGLETCDTATGTCLPGTPVDCDDGVGCTVDTCDVVNESCVNTPNDVNCPDDGLFCNGSEFCDPVNDCLSTGDPCPQGTTCNDDTDTCDIITSIDIRKQEEGLDTRTFSSGSDVSFEIVVTNTGTEDLENVVVTDIQVPDCDRNVGFLAPGDSVTYTCTAPNVTSSFENVACVSGERNDVIVEDCDPSDVEVTPLNVYLDVKPESCPNPLNVKSKGLVPVAILGTADFDVTDIDVSSILLEGVPPLKSNYEDVASAYADGNTVPLCPCNEDGPDGYMDLTLKFHTQAISAAIGDSLDSGDIIQLYLDGFLEDGTPIEGTDCVVIVGSQVDFTVGKVTICHKGNRTMVVGTGAIPAHLRHGDTLGPCE